MFPILTFQIPTFQIPADIPLPAGAPFNSIDLAIVAALLFGVAAGFSQGLVRQVLGLIGLYVATVLSAQYYHLLSLWLQPLVAGDGTVRGVISLAAIFLVAAVGLNALSYAVYQGTSLGRIAAFDRLGGAALGLIWAGCVVGVMLTVMSFGVSVSWGIQDPARLGFETVFSASQLRAPIESFLPALFNTARLWLPMGLPAAFTA